MEYSNLNSFLSVTNEDSIESEIQKILLNNKKEYEKLNESIEMLDEVLKEEMENKEKIKKEIDHLINICAETEHLFSKIIQITK